MLTLLRVWIAGAVIRFRTFGRRSIPLTIRAEADVLTQVDDVFLPGADTHSRAGTTSHLIQPKSFPKEYLSEWLAGRAGGSPMPDWASGADGVLRGGVQLSRVSNAWYIPALGAVIGPKGDIFRSTIAEALFFTPTLAAIPHVRLDKADAPRFYPPNRRKSVPRATVFASWGGLHNYGHFLLDSLPAVWLSAQNGSLQDYPPIAPPLNAWQMSLMNSLFGQDLKLVTTLEEIVPIEEIVFANTMNHFLHTPNQPLIDIREKILRRNIEGYEDFPRRVYLTREFDGKRTMVNEFELKEALIARGFIVINSTSLSIDRQISLFNNADVVISATGAGLANTLFAGNRTKIFELFPSNFPGIWVRNLCFLLSLDWYCFVSPSPIEERLIVIEGEARPGLDFSWRLMLPEFLAFLDDRI